MRKQMIAIFGVVIAVSCGIFATSTATGAAGTTVDLSIGGGTVAGYTSAQAGQELPVAFTIKNNSTTTSADIAFRFTWTNATADDFVCTLISNHLNIPPDTPFCEPGVLGPGKSTSAAIMVVPTSSARLVTVKACAMLLDSHKDPNLANNCKTVSIPIR